MWVIYSIDTGFSDESMRVATFTEMEERVDELTNADENTMWGCRWESDSPHPQNHVGLGQIWRDGKWLDFARDTPEAAIAWAQKEPAGEARVVDWISRAQIWP